jgi:hypothetical protein
LGICTCTSLCTLNLLSKYILSSLERDRHTTSCFQTFRKHEGGPNLRPLDDLLTSRHLCSSESRSKRRKFQDGRAITSTTNFSKKSSRLLWRSDRLLRQLHLLQVSDPLISSILLRRFGHPHPALEVLRTSSTMASVGRPSSPAQDKTKTEDQTSRHTELRSFSNLNASWKRFEDEFVCKCIIPDSSYLRSTPFICKKKLSSSCGWKLCFQSGEPLQ